MNNKQFEEKVREVMLEIWPRANEVEHEYQVRRMIKFAKRFYELGEMG